MFYYVTLILLPLFQQHYRYYVTCQSQESKGSYKSVRIKEEHYKLHSFNVHSYSFKPDTRSQVHSACFIKQAGIIISTILNLWKTPGIEPVTSDLTSLYKPAALPHELFCH